LAAGQLGQVPDNANMVVCKHLRYSGRVQGVGFRQTARMIADKYPVAGYVRNLPNGDVEVIAQGEADSVQSFLTEVAQRMARNIRQCVESDESAGAFSGFEIRF
jgi:acylphosphatase